MSARLRSLPGGASTTARRPPWRAACAVLALILSGCTATDAARRDAASEAAEVPALEAIVAQIDAGEFAAAGHAIDTALASASLVPERRQAYAFQRERMRRIGLDFTLDRDAAIERVRRQIPDLTEAEFEAWDAAGLIEAMRIDGQRRWFKRAPSNLFRISAQARARRANPDAPFADGPFERLHPHHVEVVEAASKSGASSVAAHRVRIVQTLDVNADAVPAGETVDAWIPFPRAIPGQQEDIVLLATDPPAHTLAPEAALQRTVHLQRNAQTGVPAHFSVSYEVTIHARRFAIDASRIEPVPALPGLAPYLAQEPPHIVFTPGLRAFSQRIVGDETDPYRIARKLFAAVDEIPWAGAREYSTIGNISDYALNAGHADCGQQTLLLIALLRLNGIPARWQSGWVFSEAADGYANLHDWGQVYLPPYGWVPMDVTTGQLDSEDESLRWFYLGGLDAYRIAFNDAISTPFVPPTPHFRSDTVDSQRGEAQWRGGNLYYDQWDYGFTAIVLSSTPASPTHGARP